MRQKTIYCTDIKTAQYHAPWAVKIVKIGGGFKAFESINDYYVWSKKQ